MLSCVFHLFNYAFVGFVTLGLGRLFGVESLTATKVTTVVTRFVCLFVCFSF